MQTIYLDISNKGVIPVVYAKQGDVGRKVEVILTNSGLPYEPEAGSAFSAWFSGASCVGNYTDIGDHSAFSVSGNKVTVELITQMLQSAGEGILCLVLSRANGDQIGLWNIRYICEGIPGAGSGPAKDYYTAFSQAVAGLAYPDASLSVAGKAADAAATGRELAGKAPAGYGLGGLANENFVADVNAAVKCGYYHVPMGALNTPTGFGEGVLHVLARVNGEYVQELFSAIYNWKCRRQTIGGIDGWGEWEWVNPPLLVGVEYRTTERIAGKAVYTKAIECGALGANSIDDVSHNTANIEAVWVSGGYWFDGTLYYSLPYFGTSDNQVLVSTYASVIHRQLLGSAYNIQGMVVVLKYTKTTG